MNRDLRKIRRHERSAEWSHRRVRQDVFLPLGMYSLGAPPPKPPTNPTLIAHPQYPDYGYFPSDPNQLYRLPQTASVASAAPKEVSVEIINAGRLGATVDCVVDGVTYKIESGGRQKLAVGSASTIAYDPGGGLGAHRYTLTPGVYEFRQGNSGWAFFKLRPTAE